MVKKRVMLILVLFVFLISVSLISANTKLLCVDKGQKIEFSRCNPLIPDRVCTTQSGCQFCVNEASKGIYCPVFYSLHITQKGDPCSLDESSNLMSTFAP